MNDLKKELYRILDDWRAGVVSYQDMAQENSGDENTYFQMLGSAVTLNSCVCELAAALDKDEE